MIFEVPGSESILPFAINLLILLWLGACAVFDVRTHQVPNGLTLPAIPMALLAAWLTRENQGEKLSAFLFHLVLLCLALFIAWRQHLLGGADLKILLVLAIANPRLFAAAWMGVIVYFLVLLFMHHRRLNRFIGVPGFALGIGLFTIGQLALVFTQHPGA